MLPEAIQQYHGAADARRKGAGTEPAGHRSSATTTRDSSSSTTSWHETKKLILGGILVVQGSERRSRRARPTPVLPRAAQPTPGSRRPATLALHRHRPENPHRLATPARRDLASPSRAEESELAQTPALENRLLRDHLLRLERLDERPGVVVRATSAGHLEQDVGGALGSDAVEVTAGELDDGGACLESLEGPEDFLDDGAKDELRRNRGTGRRRRATPCRRGASVSGDEQRFAERARDESARDEPRNATDEAPVHESGDAPRRPFAFCESADEHFRPGEIEFSEMREGELQFPSRSVATLRGLRFAVRCGFGPGHGGSFVAARCGFGAGHGRVVRRRPVRVRRRARWAGRRRFVRGRRRSD